MAMRAVTAAGLKVLPQDQRERLTGAGRGMQNKEAGATISGGARIFNCKWRFWVSRSLCSGLIMRLW